MKVNGLLDQDMTSIIKRCTININQNNLLAFRLLEQSHLQHLVN